MKIAYLIWTVAIVTVIGGAAWYAQMQRPATETKSSQLPATNTADAEPVSTTTSPAPVLSPVPIKNQQAPQPKRSPQAPQKQPEATSSSPLSPSPEPRSFTVNANDSTADLTDISVPKGTPVTLTFNVSITGTYYGGLEFRSSVVSTGSIGPGAAKTVLFTADTPFSFTPYWPTSNVVKPYRINILIQEAATSTAGEASRATEAASSQTIALIHPSALGAQKGEVCWSIINGRVFNPAASGWTTQRTFATRQKQFFNLQCKTPGTNAPMRHVRRLLFR